MSLSITESRTTSAGPPPTASRKSVSPEKQSSSLTTKATPSSECPGVGIASTWSPPVSIDPVDDRDPEALARAAPRARRGRRWPCVRRMCVGASRSRSSVVEQRLERRAAVDEDRDAARLVADDEGVREPAPVHRALDDHRLRRLRDAAPVGKTPAVTRALVSDRRGARARRRPRQRRGARRRPVPARRATRRRGDRARGSRRRPDRHARERAQHAAHRRGAELAARRHARRPSRCIELGDGPPPTRSSSSRPRGRERERPLPDRGRAGAARRPHVRLDADRRPRLARRRRARAARGRRGRRPGRRRSSGSSDGSSGTTASGCRSRPRRRDRATSPRVFAPRLRRA